MSGALRDCGAQVLLNATGSQPQPASGVARDHLLQNGIGVQPGQTTGHRVIQ